MPRIDRKVPADMSQRTKRHLFVRHFQPDEADEPLIVRSFDSPLSEAVLFEARLEGVDERVALLPCERSQPVSHDLGVSVDLRERLAVVVGPAPQNKTLGTENGGL